MPKRYIPFNKKNNKSVTGFFVNKNNQNLDPDGEDDQQRNERIQTEVPSDALALQSHSSEPSDTTIATTSSTSSLTLNHSHR